MYFPQSDRVIQGVYKCSGYSAIYSSTPLAEHRAELDDFAVMRKVPRPNVLIRMTPEEGPKLTADKVKKIKLALFRSKKQPTLKMLAKQFKVSDMQIHRIKIGENWGHVKI